MQTLRASPLLGKLTAGTLAAILLIFAIPAPAHAIIPGDICLFLGLAGTEVVGAVAGAEGISMAGLGASAGMLAVPTFDFWNAQQNALFNAPFVAETSVHERANTTKTCEDVIMTAILKTIINLVRDMTIRWISTGRFDMPVFSQSFTVDIAKTAENASRIFLTELTGINFCSSFGIPSIGAFTYSLNLGLSCTAGSDFDKVDFFLHPEKYDEKQRYVLSLPENEYGQTLLRAAQAKTESEARAVISKAAEYAAGQGFLGIRDKDGKIVTPGSAVAKLVMEQTIVSPVRQTDVANTTQQAIAAIVDTAIRTIVEKGLATVAGR